MKAIIVLSGANAGKTKFVNFAKFDQHYWCWNTNPYNVVGESAKVLDWKGPRNEKYYEFIKELHAIGDKIAKYNNGEGATFDGNKINEMIKNFRNDPKPQLLIIHGITTELSNTLRNENPEVFAIHICDKLPEVEVNCYDKIILMDENFEACVIGALNIITADFPENFEYVDEENN
jgi:hypothetical protein